MRVLYGKENEMKITYEIPDSARALSLCCVWKDENGNGLVVGQHMADSDDLKDGVVLVPVWKGGVNE